MSGEEPDIIVTVQDARAIGYCRRGSHKFSELYGLDWIDFLENGIPASKLRSLGDALVEKAIEQAKKRIKAEAENGQV
jgi:hypothetical protein